ncbi:autoinducer binding domain-containing protein [Mesorhizobium sp. CAU 1741]|uniref:helix-turn-helix transcriptional regulator n=1 Tax=Mesorhizobium sp. CAU 1741 TaxID=3140366 RepID=UPI00325A53D4
MDKRRDRQLMNQVASLLDGLETCRDEKHLKSALHRFTRSIGFEHFAYVCAAGQDAKTVTDLPVEWERRYNNERYVVVDPVVRHARQSSAPFVWSLPTLADKSGASAKFRDEIAKVGVVSGATIPMQAGFGRTAMLSFISAEQMQPQIGLDALQSALVAVAYTHFHVMQKVPPISARHDQRLTPREKMCVIWTSLGKRQADIAQIYGLSEKTVRFYLDNAKAKFNADNVAHLIRLAGEAGILTR